MPRGNVQVRITADTDNLRRGTASASQDLKKLDRTGSKSLNGLKVAAAAAGAAITGGLVIGLKSSVEAAIDAEKSQKKLIAQLHASNIAYKAHAKEIDKVIQAHSKLAGIDDEDLQDAFTNIVRVTGSVSKSLKEVGLVTDLVRAKNLDVAKAGELVGKVMNGNTNVLKRYGVAVQPVTAAQDALAASHKKVTVEQQRAAKETDKQATVQRALAAAQKAFGGQAEAFGKTSAGAMARAGVATENLQEALGAKLLPAVTKVAQAFADFVNKGVTVHNLQSQLQHSFGLSKTAFNAVAVAVTAAAAAMVAYRVAALAAALANPVTAVVALTAAFVAFVATSKDAQRQLLKVGDTMLGLFTAVIRAEGAVARLVGSLIPGSDAMDRFADKAEVAEGRINKLRERMRDAASPFHDLDVAARQTGDSLATNLKKGVSGADALGRAVTSVNTKFDGLQRAADAALGTLGQNLNSSGTHLKQKGDGLGPAPGKGSAALLGARSSLAPFAGIGAGFGLHVSSGLRPGAITSSGNTSYHSSGEAIDEAGDPRGMIGFFNTMKSRFGSKLAELIYTPGGQGIKNGRPFTYTGQVAADHFDHVHVALDTGKPGVGDGYGKSALEGLWKSAGGPASAANVAAAVALAESGGESTARNASGASGLWQILGQVVPGNIFNPAVNARNAVRKWRSAHGFSPWVAYNSGAYKKFLGKVTAKQTAAAKRAATKAPRLDPKSAQKAHAVGTTGKFYAGVTDQQIAEAQSQRDYDTARGAALADEDQHRRDMADQAAQDSADAAATKAMDDLTEQLRITNDKLELQTTLAQEALRKYNVSQSDYGTLKRALADVVSTELGGRIGLGFMTPGYAGGGTRY